MDPEYSLQDVLRCHLCETLDVPLYCDLCQKYLCQDCKEKHLSDESREHKVKSFKINSLDPEYSLQDVVRCHLCETPDVPLYCDLCQKYLCQDCNEKHLSDESREHKVKSSKINSLDPEYSLQDVVRCHLCESPVPPLHCVNCNIHLCKDCKKKHLSDKSKEHNIVSKKKKSTTQNDEPHPPVTVITDIKTKFGSFVRLLRVSCLSDEHIWVSGDEKTMRLYNLQGDLVKYVETKSGNWPRDIAVKRSGELVYSDDWNKTVNIVNNTDIIEVIICAEWKPRGVCVTSSDDLLVIMVSNQNIKIVRYSDSKEIQSIQFDDKRQPLYSSGDYISENRNLDICMSDPKAHAVVVVNEAGQLRFIYKGAGSSTKEPFDPRGITTDSQSRILTSERYNSRIHIIDKEGQFLRYIENSDLRSPWGLCVDLRDNLFVAESKTGKVKKIHYNI